MRLARRSGHGANTISSMSAVAIPWAPVWIQVICGIPLASVTFFGLRWGSRNLRLSVKILRGVAPPPSRSTKVLSGTLGMIFHLAVLVVALSSGYFLCVLLTTQPTVVAESGVIIGAHLPKFQARVMGWGEITGVECGMPPRSNEIRRLVVRSKTEAVELGSAAVALEPVRVFIAQHTAPETVRPCKHEIYDHGWSY